jgi:AhpD family alkylhydroperoxidase
MRVRPGTTRETGLLPQREVELVILRVATLRDCAYELDHHLRLGRAAGLTDDELAGHYELLATTITALRLPVDEPRSMP